MQNQPESRKPVTWNKETRTSRRPRILGRSRLWLIFLMLPLLWLVLAGRSQAASGRVISLAVDGQRRGFTTDANSVAEVLARAEVRLNQDDLVEPSLDTTINTGVFYINVYRAKPAVVVDGAKEIPVVTPYTNPKLIAARSAGLKIFPEDEFTSQLNRDFVGPGPVGHRIVIDRAVPVTLIVDGRPLKLRTNQETVGQLLREKKIVLDKSDLVKPKSVTKIRPNMKIRVIRVGVKTISVREAIPRPIEVIFDNNKPAGYEQIREEGADGKQLVTYKVRYHNGVIVRRVVLQQVVITKPVTQVVVRGVTASGDVWLQLRLCESGGDYTKNTGNGYYGAYQFSYGTWQSMGTGYEYAHQAPPNVQDAAAQDLQARSGWGQWPHCASQLGLY